ncbi:MAG: carboxypeptidase-like regulatory domain-containing protein, partial [Pyrinomonadaceae bacterium]
MKKFFSLSLGFGLVITLLAMMFQPVSLYAQLTRGAITGTVTDESGAVVSGATVKIVNPSTNLSRDTTTNDQGIYRVAALDPGTYSVIIEKTGFQAVENRQVQVKTALEVTFDAALKVGNVGAVVDVTAVSEAITLNKTTPTIGLTATARQAVELPLNVNRNDNDLALLSPNAFRAPGSSGI